MQKRQKALAVSAFVSILLSVALTIALAAVDVRPIGPFGSQVGFATFNEYVFWFIGERIVWYHITDWLGISAVLTAIGFAVRGLVQLIRRRSLLLVDRRILILGGFYLIVLAVYLLFEHHIVNYRPILMNGHLEASFPSSHTMIICCIMVTAMDQFRYMIKNRRFRTAVNAAASAIMLVTIAGRTVSGVHWFTDILAGLLFAAALLCIYFAAVNSAKCSSSHE